MWFDYLRGWGSATESGMLTPYHGAGSASSSTGAETNNYEIGANVKGWWNGFFSQQQYCLAIRRPDAKVGKWASSPQECTYLHKGTVVSGQSMYLGNATGGGLGGGAFGTFDMMFNMRRIQNISYQPKLQNTNRLMSVSSPSSNGSSLRIVVR